LVRRAIPRPDLAAVRAAAARRGWLVESPEALRAGIGGPLAALELPAGTRRSATEVLGGFDLAGDDGPAGSGVVGFGALPFDPTGAGRLDVPEGLVTVTAEGSWLTSSEGVDPLAELRSESPATQEPVGLRSVTYQPTAEEYAHQVALAVEILRRKEIDKVVLARAVHGTLSEDVDIAAVAARLRAREPICTVYALPTADGRRFVGASPELLVRRSGDEVACHPLAGTISLPANADPNDYEAWLLGSAKNLHEHAVVVDEIVSLLAADYDDLSADATPSIVALRSVAHLGSWVVGRRRDGGAAPDALALLRVLHPTAAVGGLPRTAALDLIARLEDHDRGCFAGPVGWADAQGDGEWWIGLRGVLVAGLAFEAWAGAGIVSESDPVAEREETRDKLAVVLSALLADRV
ncbi:MAG TPA: isochorismate synthase, partial [Acidimicrobiales bacterium]|nr:isochorismate synthase [Acidimicrobiales bacterium]